MATYEAKIQDWVIDVDTHITEPGDLWTSRVPARYKDLAPRIVRDPATGVETWALGDSPGFMPVGFTAMAGWPEPFPSAPRNMEEAPKAAYDASARLEYMDRVGIWARDGARASIAYPPRRPFVVQWLVSTRDNLSHWSKQGGACGHRLPGQTALWRHESHQLSAPGPSADWPTPCKVKGGTVASRSSGACAAVGGAP